MTSLPMNDAKKMLKCRHFSYVLPTPTSIIACSYFTRIKRRSRSGSSSCRFSSLKAPQHFVRTSVIFCSSCQCVMLLSQKLRTVFLFKQDRNSIRRTIQLLKSELDKMVFLDFQQITKYHNSHFLKRPTFMIFLSFL